MSSISAVIKNLTTALLVNCAVLVDVCLSLRWKELYHGYKDKIIMYHSHGLGFFFLWIACTLGKNVSKEKKKKKDSRELLLHSFPSEWQVLVALFLFVPSLFKSAAKPKFQVLTVPLYILVRTFPSLKHSGQIPVQTMIYCCSNDNLETSVYRIETKDKVVYYWCVMDEMSPGCSCLL